MDILDSEALWVEIANFSTSHIINLAAQTGTTDRGRKLEDYATNFRGLRNLLDIARNTPSVERLISTSSMLVCKNGYQPQNETNYFPDTLYGQSKVLGEKLLREAEDLPYYWVIVRPTGIWGPWFDVPYKNLFKMISKGFYVHPGDNNVNQSLGFVDNFRPLVFTKGSKKKRVRKFNKDSGHQVEFSAFFSAIQKGEFIPVDFEVYIYTTLATFCIQESFSKGIPIEVNTTL